MRVKINEFYYSHGIPQIHRLIRQINANEKKSRCFFFFAFLQSTLYEQDELAGETTRNKCSFASTVERRMLNSKLNESKTSGKTSQFLSIYCLCVI